MLTKCAEIYIHNGLNRLEALSYVKFCLHFCIEQIKFSYYEKTHILRLIQDLKIARGEIMRALSPTKPHVIATLLDHETACGLT